MDNSRIAPETIEQVVSLFASGLSPQEIADTCGVAKSTVFRVARFHYHSFRRSHIDSLRATVQDMRPMDALEHTLTILEMIVGDAPAHAPSHPLDPYLSLLTPMQRRIVMACATSPYPVPPERLFSIIYADRNPNDYPDKSVLRTLVSMARRRLQNTPVRIVRIPHAGYVIRMAEG